MVSGRLTLESTEFCFTGVSRNDLCYTGKQQARNTGFLG